MNNTKNKIVFKSILKEEYKPFFEPLLTYSKQSKVLMCKPKQTYSLTMVDLYFNDVLDFKNNGQTELMNSSHSKKKEVVFFGKEVLNSENSSKTFCTYAQTKVSSNSKIHEFSITEEMLD